MAEKKQNVYGATYTRLPEPQLSTELARLANPQAFGPTDVASLQPCPTPSERTQDRFVVAEWPLADGLWRFQAVCDGHAGHDTVDHVVATLPHAVQSALVARLAAGPPHSPDDVGLILRNAIADVDDGIAHDLLELFPGGPDAVASLSDDDIAAIVNDGGQNSAKILRCMRGSTVLVALISPALDVWVASLGDCQAVLGVKQASGAWEASVLSANHNGTDAAEVARIRSEHPGEDECVLRDRVLGAIAVTRAVGDFLFKLPTIYTTRIFMNARPGFQFSSKIADFLGRNLTPPYLSAQCHLQHVHVPALGGTEAFLVLASDGLIDLSGDTYGYDHREPSVGGKKWVEVLGRRDRSENAALYLIRDAMGQDEDAVSSLLTVEDFEGRWMDDTTVVVTQLQGAS
ncbi:protein serine/threonine phosphatase 2C [Mycena rosella]|uniref:Protein serine/threonine phosphatase 2C n=1 Tax=Mycena rosella TaxID=1033263 RepID=A0AAD7D1X5_MYCRO|nr:protein serine/threonine phosphatase 2C [Mycena rosella]